MRTLGILLPLLVAFSACKTGQTQGHNPMQAVGCPLVASATWVRAAQTISEVRGRVEHRLTVVGIH